jgi:hypothetical protein
MTNNEVRAIQKALRDIFLQDLSMYKTRLHMFNHILAEISRVCLAGTEMEHKDFREWILWGDACQKEIE